MRDSTGRSNRAARGLPEAALAALLALACLSPAPARALHSPTSPGQDGSVCGHCHNLSSTGATDPGTSMIILGSRTLTAMKAANGGAVPDVFGCTYCHNDSANTEMRGVLSHFRNDRSRHPVGERFVGFLKAVARIDTGNEYLSGVTGTTGAADELECLDCHDARLVDDPESDPGNYVDHVPRFLPDGSGEPTVPNPARAGNPAMLRNVTVAGEHDALCRSCHGSSARPAFDSDYKAASAIDLRLLSHRDGSDAAANAMRELDGTVIRTADPDGDGVPDDPVPANQCTACHGAHATDRVKLFNAAVGSGSDCTTLCHYAGDRDGSYRRGGHGKERSAYEYGGLQMDMAIACTECHVALDTTSADKAARKRHAPGAAITATGDRAAYKDTFNLAKNLSSSDRGTDAGNPQWGVCIGCHSLVKYRAHFAHKNAAAGCQDCHDEHGEGAGAAANAFMIPRRGKRTGFFKTATPAASAGRGGAEEVVYERSRFLADGATPSGGPYDFYRADGNGVCDNTECHTGPLQTRMTGAGHAGGDQPPGADCASCHDRRAP